MQCRVVDYKYEAWLHTGVMALGAPEMVKKRALEAAQVGTGGKGHQESWGVGVEQESHG